MPMSNASIGPFAMNGCHSTIGAISMKCDITPHNGCGAKTMNTKIWHWAVLPPNSGLPWPHSSISQSSHLRENYLFPTHMLVFLCKVHTPITLYIVWLFVLARLTLLFSFPLSVFNPTIHNNKRNQEKNTKINNETIESKRRNKPILSSHYPNSLTK